MCLQQLDQRVDNSSVTELQRGWLLLFKRLLDLRLQVYRPAGHNDTLAFMRAAMTLESAGKLLYLSATVSILSVQQTQPVLLDDLRIERLHNSLSQPL